MSVDDIKAWIDDRKADAATWPTLVKLPAYTLDALRTAVEASQEAEECFLRGDGDLAIAALRVSKETIRETLGITSAVDVPGPSITGEHGFGIGYEKFSTTDAAAPTTGANLHDADGAGTRR